MAAAGSSQFPAAPGGATYSGVLGSGGGGDALGGTDADAETRGGGGYAVVGASPRPQSARFSTDAPTRPLLAARPASSRGLRSCSPRAMAEAAIGEVTTIVEVPGLSSRPRSAAVLSEHRPGSSLFTPGMPAGPPMAT